MKQTLRKILSVILALTLVFSIGIISMSTGASGSILFSDDFSATSSLTDRGWHNNTPTVVDGALKVSNGRLTLSLPEAENWTDYSVEADVRVDFLDGSTASEIIAALCVRSNTDAKKAYEFGIGYKRTNTSDSFIRLYQRTNSTVTFDKNPVKDTTVSLAFNQYHHLRIDVIGDTITCYLNNDPTPVITVTDSAFGAGTITLRASNCVGWYDNIVVKGLNTVESSSEAQSSSDVATSTPEESSSTPSAPAENVYFSDDFSAANTSGRGWNKNVATPNGNLVITGSNNYLTGNAEYKAWTDYAVEVEVSSIDLTATAASMNHATLVGRATSGKSGYEFRLITTTGTFATKAQLYEQETGNIATINNIDWDYTKSHKLKMVFNGSTILCFVDDVLVMKATSTKYTAGSVALKSAGYSATFDNIVVREATSAEINAQFPGDDTSSVTSTTTSSTTTSSATSSTTTSSTVTSSTVTSSSSVSSTTSSSTSSSGNSDVYFQDDFSAANTSGRGWNKNIATPNGNLVITGSNNYLTGKAEYKAWTDYAVEVEVSSIDLTSASASMNHATLIGRTTSGTTGYEFRLITTTGTFATKAQLYDCSTKKNIATVNSIDWDYTKSHKLKMVFNGSNILCFVDDVLVMKATSTSFSAGAIALKSAGYAATFDNVVVRKATQAEINANFPQDSTSSNTSSGSTPNSDVYFTDDFSSASTSGRGWNKTIDTPNGYLSFENTSTTNVYLAVKSEHKALTNYAAEVDIKVERNVMVPNTTNNYSYFVVRTTGGTSGYYFRYLIAADGSKYVDLYDYATKKTIASNKTYKLSFGITYKFKVVVQDDLILCFINDELVMKATSNSFANGAVALRNEGNAARFDNLVIRKATEAEINATFRQPTAPTANDKGIYFEDAFDTRKQSMSTSAIWNSVFADVVNGQAVLSEALQTNNFVVGDGGYYLLKDYTVQSTVSLAKAAYSNGVTTAGVSGRMSGAKSGYEFYLSIGDDGSAPSIVLFDRTNNKTLATNTTVQIEHDTEYVLTLAMVGSTIRGYVDGALVVEVLDAGNTAGTAGLISTGLEGYYDNFVVRQPSAAEVKGATTIVVNPGTGDQSLWIAIAVLVLALACGAYVCARLFKKKKQD